MKVYCDARKREIWPGELCGDKEKGGVTSIRHGFSQLSIVGNISRDTQMLTILSVCQPRFGVRILKIPTHNNRNTPIYHSQIMTGFQDIRDVMDISGPIECVARAPPSKKQKTVEKRPGLFYFLDLQDLPAYPINPQTESLGNFSRYLERTPHLWLSWRINSKKSQDGWEKQTLGG